MHGQNDLKTAALRELSPSAPEQHPGTDRWAKADMSGPAAPVVDTQLIWVNEFLTVRLKKRKKNRENYQKKFIRLG